MTIETVNKIKSIEIRAKEWFDKVNGNSYFSARIYINDEQITILPFQYGYGDHYLDMAMEYLTVNNLIDNDRHSNGSYGALWCYCEDNDIKLISFKQEGCLKRQLDKE